MQIQQKSNGRNIYINILSFCFLGGGFTSDFSSISLSGGVGEGLPEGERTRRFGVAKSDVISNVTIRTALTHILRGRVQGGGLRQEVSPTSYIITAIKANSCNKNILMVLLPLLFSVL